MKYFYLLFLIQFLTSCTSTTSQNKPLNNELQSVKDTLNNLKAEQSGTLTHLVFFDVKEGIDLQKLILRIHELDKIPEVKDMAVGPFTSLDDPRALDQYELVMEMSFDSELAYKKYQNHPIHLQLKKDLASQLSSAPATYDFTRAKF